VCLLIPLPDDAPAVATLATNPIIAARMRIERDCQAANASVGVDPGDYEPGRIGTARMAANTSTHDSQVPVPTPWVPSAALQRGFPSGSKDTQRVRAVPVW